MPIRVLVLDFWNTLMMGSDKEHISKIAEKLKFDSQESFWNFNDAHLFPTKMRMKEFFEYTLDLKKINNVTADELMDYWTRAWKTVKPFPSTIPVLEELSSKYNLVLLSNTSWEEANKALDMFNLRGYFYDILLSPEFGIAKPNLEFFQKVLDNTNVSPSEVCLVGDDINNDIIPARRIGFKTILIDREGKHTNHESPDVIIKSLKELKNSVE